MQCYFASGGGEVEGDHFEDIEGIEQYLLLVFVGLVGQSEPIYLDEAMVIKHLLLVLGRSLHYYLEQVRVIVHEFLGL